uniref:Uncharacterized protein n=1 Tax=Setaria viridis TaxID=4556 RepID=A0A4U6U7Y8_SETVI|nr:hypothetical protein SEVIR_6G181200v2 [Setaria viridis]
MREQGDDTIDGVAIPISDAIADEVVIIYDKDQLKMDLGTMYPSMDEFSRLAFLLGEGSSSHATTTTPQRMPTVAPQKKMTPKRQLQIG